MDYFLKFNRAMGIELFDKYIELTKMYIAMSPAEKVYHAKNIMDNKYTKKDIPHGRFSLPDFLELKQMRLNLNNDNIQEMNANLNTTTIENMYNIIHNTYKSLPKITYLEFAKLLERNTLIPNKSRYLYFIAPINIKRKIYYAKKIRKMFLK